MILQVLGCSHHDAPLTARQQLAPGPGQVSAVLAELRQARPDIQAALLSTCSRLELYTASGSGDPVKRRQVAELFAGFQDLDADDVLAYLYELSGRDAVKHLLLVASCLDGVAGDDAPIMSQLDLACKSALRQKAAGPIIQTAFQAAFRVARRVADETAVHDHRLSIPGVATAELARFVFDKPHEKKTLVLGAGTMVEQTLCYLQEDGAGELTVASQNPQRAADLARRRNARVQPWSERFELLKTADLVISCSGAGRPIVSRSQFATLEPCRMGRPLLVLDLAIPPDFDADIGKRPGVYLQSMDGLRQVCEQNRRQREKELPLAMRIVDEEADRFMDDLQLHDLGPVILKLEQVWSQPKEVELQRLFHKLPDLNEQSRQEIIQSFERLTSDLFHPPLETIRMEARNGEPTELLDALARLYRCRAA